MLTPEIVKEAIETSHTTCAASPTGCTHASSLATSANALYGELAKALAISLEEQYTLSELAMAILNDGIHIGYRMHELETATTPVNKSAVN